jgi:RNA polymerase sigma factor (sigma-70 family)
MGLRFMEPRRKVVPGRGMVDWYSTIQAFSPRVRAIARGYALDDIDADEVVQNTWLRLLEQQDHIIEPSRLGGWLLTVARRESLQLAARRERESEAEKRQELGAIPQLTESDPKDAAVARDHNRQLWAAYDRLSERERLLLRLVVVDPPTSYQEIATALGMSVGSIGPTRQRTLIKLRRLMAEPDVPAVSEPPLNSLAPQPSIHLSRTTDEAAATFAADLASVLASGAQRLPTWSRSGASVHPYTRQTVVGSDDLVIVVVDADPTTDQHEEWLDLIEAAWSTGAALLSIVIGRAAIPTAFRQWPSIVLAEGSMPAGDESVEQAVAALPPSQPDPTIRHDLVARLVEIKAMAEAMAGGTGAGPVNQL